MLTDCDITYSSRSLSNFLTIEECLLVKWAIKTPGIYFRQGDWRKDRIYRAPSVCVCAVWLFIWQVKCAVFMSCKDFHADHGNDTMQADVRNCTVIKLNLYSLFSIVIVIIRIVTPIKNRVRPVRAIDCSIGKKFITRTE